jgi:hypothetical protein
MATITGTPLTARSGLLRSIALGGTFIFVNQLITLWIMATLIQGTPYLVVLQYIASGAVGESAFTGGAATALLGVVFHLLISFIVAAIFLVAADRIPLVRRNVLVSGLLYGVAVFFVMNLLVVPLSATPAIPPPTLPWLIVSIIEHTLLIGLPLGYLARRT